MTVSTVDEMSDDEIVLLCQGEHADKPIIYGHRMKRISDDVIVKFGWIVSPDEAANQQYAHLSFSENQDQSSKSPSIIFTVGCGIPCDGVYSRRLVGEHLAG